MDTPPPPAQIEAAIRRYLQDHPQAFDTERGIAEWWLRGLHPPPLGRAVHQAIDNLVAAGALVPVTLPDGQLAYANGTRPLDPP